MYCFRQGCAPRGNGRGLSLDYLLVLTRKLKFGWLNVITFRGQDEGAEIETAVSLGVKSRFTDMRP